MRFESSVKELQKAVKELEKASKTAAKKKVKMTASSGQIDMFSVPSPSNDIDVEALKKQLDVAISSMETLIREYA